MNLASYHCSNLRFVQPIFTDELHLIMIYNITFSFAEFLQSHQNNSETFGDTIGFEPIFPYDKNGIFKLYDVLPITLSISLIYVFKVRKKNIFYLKVLKSHSLTQPLYGVG